MLKLERLNTCDILLHAVASRIYQNASVKRELPRSGNKDIDETVWEWLLSRDQGRLVFQE
jgi:hypothetical protein